MGNVEKHKQDNTAYIQERQGDTGEREYPTRGRLFQNRPLLNAGHHNIVLFGTLSNQQNKELHVLSYFLLS